MGPRRHTRACLVALLASMTWCSLAWAKAPSPVPKKLDELLGTRWYGVYVLDHKAGHAKTTLSRKGRRIALSEEVHVDVRAFGTSQTIDLKTERTYDARSGRIMEIRTTFEQGAQRVEGRLKVTGSTATLDQKVAGEAKTRTIPAPDETLRHALSVQLLVLEGAAAGATAVSSSFEPLPPFERSLTMEHVLERRETKVVDGVPLEVAHIRTRSDEQGLDVTTLVRKDGVVLQSELMGMMRMRLEPEAVARGKVTSPDVLALTLARPSRPLKDTGRMSEAVLRLRLPERPPTFDDGHVEVLSKGADGRLEVRLRRGSPTPTRGPEERAHGLEPTALVQSRHPKLVAEASNVTRGARTEADKVGRIVRHVHRTVRKEYRAALSNALDVHSDRAGDCTEHSVYFVALARAAGIPARLVVGLAYTGESGGGFGGHAWAEVLLGHRWVAVDPTFGQERADAAHIPLGIGNLSDIGHVIALIGKVDIDVVRTQHQPASRGAR